jgi:threonine synthase
MITNHEEYQKLAKQLDIKSLYFKREDTHPYGSHKGRSIPTMIDIYIKEGFSHFVISSSGNAALAAVMYIEELNERNKNQILLEVLVGRHISTKKLDKLRKYEDDNISITMHDRPVQTLFIKTKDENIKALRQSNDDTALIGYESLAAELIKIPKLEAIFIGASSGTTAHALSEYFVENNYHVETHIVQTSSCHPIADNFVDDEILDEQSIADAIVDHTALRKDILTDLIIKTKGNAWIVSNDEIKTAQEITRKYTDLEISTNSALSVAGLMQAISPVVQRVL